MIVADTDVLIDFLRCKGAGADRIALELNAGRLATTAITAFELDAGARTRKQREAVGALLAALRILPLDDESAREAGRIRRDLEKDGTPIGMADYLIAGICMTNSSLLLTRNVQHFARIDGLKLGTVERGR